MSDQTALWSGSLLAAPEAAQDRMWMARALEQAGAAASAGEVPVGAILVRGERLVAEAHNRTITDADPTGHAEILVLRAAGALQGDFRLTNASLYVTLEPCAMCAGAAVLARIQRIVYGATDPKAGMAGTLGNLVQDDRLNHRCLVTPGVLATESSDLLTAFFQERR